VQLLKMHLLKKSTHTCKFTSKRALSLFLTPLLYLHEDKLSKNFSQVFTYVNSNYLFKDFKF